MELLKLGHLVHARIELRNVARPFLLQLAEATETTVNLAVLNQSELEILFVEQIDSPNEVQVKVRTGARAAPHCTAVGKVIAAFMEPRFTELLLQKEGMVKRTKNTITDPEKLRRELADVRARGYATDREEAVEGACCVGAPVRDHRGEVVAAVSVSMMARRMRNWPEARLVSMVTATGAKISAALGYQRGSSAGRAPGAM
jgi:DNA-binding IclR family transcriptional regulator